MSDSVLGLIDASPYTKPVCDLAIWSSKQLNIPIRLLHLLDRETNNVSLPTSISGNDIQQNELIQEFNNIELVKARLAQKLGHAVLDDAVSYIKRHDIEDIDPRLRHDDLLDALDVYAPKSSLVIIGKRGQDANEQQRRLGAHFEMVVRSSEKPILVASKVIRPIRNVLIAFDGGPLIKKAVDFICTSPLFKDTNTILSMAGKMDKEIEQSFDEHMEKLQKTGRNPQSLRAAESVENMISNAIDSQSVDLVVMGAYNHSKLRNFFFGSMSQNIIINSSVPVLIVRDLNDRP